MKKKTARRKAIDIFMEEGLFQTAEEALPYFLGGQVYCGQERITSPAQLVACDKPMTVKGRELPFVAKGGLKLQGAMQDFGISAKDRICIDAGACTGGFTDCLAKSGALLVYAVEVGFGQLAGSLRQNPKVVNLEKTNLSDEKLLSLSPRPDLASVDLSYLSLRKAVPVFANIMGYEGELICLVKPLFEVEDAAARRTGILSDDVYLPLLLSLIRDLNGLPRVRVVNVTNSPVTGNQGTLEFFLHIKLGEQAAEIDLGEAAAEAVQRVLKLDSYRKA
jgi:23S rRNA (cytidine1920-2'-O)/16S rRNA (cytidine1409-2'-O)-methyltransferase